MASWPRYLNKTIDLVGPWTSDQELCDRDITDLWAGEAVEEGRSIAAMEDLTKRYDRMIALELYYRQRFGCADAGHILFMKALGKHRAARGEQYDYTVYNPDDTDSDIDSAGDDADDADPDDVDSDKDDSNEDDG